MENEQPPRNDDPMDAVFARLREDEASPAADEMLDQPTRGWSAEERIEAELAANPIEDPVTEYIADDEIADPAVLPIEPETRHHAPHEPTDPHPTPTAHDHKTIEMDAVRELAEEERGSLGVGTDVYEPKNRKYIPSRRTAVKIALGIVVTSFVASQAVYAESVFNGAHPVLDRPLGNKLAFGITFNRPHYISIGLGKNNPAARAYNEAEASKQQSLEQKEAAEAAAKAKREAKKKSTEVKPTTTEQPVPTTPQTAPVAPGATTPAETPTQTTATSPPAETAPVVTPAPAPQTTPAAPAPNPAATPQAPTP